MTARFIVNELHAIARERGFDDPTDDEEALIAGLANGLTARGWRVVKLEGGYRAIDSSGEDQRMHVIKEELA